MRGGLFEVLGPAAPEWHRRMIRRRYGRNEAIFQEGELGDTFHVIDKGRVLVAVSTAVGDVAAMAVRGPGDILGELALVGGGRRTARVTALEPTETLTLTQAGLDQLRAEVPDVDRFLLEIVAAKLQESTALLMEVLFVPVETRVLRVVARLARAFDDGTEPVVIRIRQEDIAAMAGTRRQTANRPLRQAQDDGVLRIARGRVEVIDRDRLEALAS